MDVNPETITGTLSWYKILPLNRFNLIRAKRKLLKKRACERFSSRRDGLKLTISLAKPVKTYHGITVLQHSIGTVKARTESCKPDRQLDGIWEGM